MVGTGIDCLMLLYIGLSYITISIDPICLTVAWCEHRQDVLRQSARQEYELARHEQDPELVSGLMCMAIACALCLGGLSIQCSWFSFCVE